MPGLDAHAGRDQSRKTAASGKARAYSHSPTKNTERAMAAAAVAVTVAVAVADPLPAVGVAPAAAALSIVAALRVQVRRHGLACLFHPCSRRLPARDEDTGSVGRRGLTWSSRGAYPRGEPLRRHDRGRRGNLRQLW